MDDSVLRNNVGALPAPKQRPWAPLSPAIRGRHTFREHRERALAALRAALHRSESPRDQSVVLSDATRHPNGFLKIPIGNETPTRRLFLHVWQHEVLEADIHDHRWSFESVVLAGALRNTAFALAAAGSDDTGLFIAEHVPEGRSFMLRDLGVRPVVAVRLPKPTPALRSGDRYTQRASLLHRVEASAGTVSLVTRGAGQRASSRVLLPERANHSRKIQLDIVDKAEVHDLVRSLIARLESA